MAENPGSDERYVGAAKLQAQARQHQKAGVIQRETSQVILAPDDVAGAYDAARVLFTTLGGKPRPITRDDLLAFQASAKLLGKRFKGGVTAKQVIDLSIPAARRRAEQQIHTGFPVTSTGGRVKFQTNAGPDSHSSHHMVTIEFMNFDACVVSPVAPKDIVKQMLAGPIKIDCDCEDWRYRLRYIATKGKYAAGPWFESGFPKITNPLLHGVGCKHVLRIAKLIDSSPTFKMHAIGLLAKARQHVERKVANTHVKDMKKFADALKKENSRQKSLKTSEEKRAQRQAQPSYQRQVVARKAMREAAAKKPIAQQRVPDAKFLQMLMHAGYSQAAAQAALAAAKSAA
jgi:hypothetical protein